MRILFRLTVIFVVLTSFGWGEEYTLSGLFSYALDEDSQLRRIEASVSEAGTRINDAKASFQPSLDASFRAAYTSELPEMELAVPGGTKTVEAGVKDTYAAVLTARQLIFSGFARQAALDGAQNSLATERFRAQARDDSVRFGLLQAAYRYSLAKLSVDSLNASLARLQLNRRRVSSFFDQGFSSELDLLEIDSTITDLKLKLSRQEADRDSALIVLRRLTGRDDLEDLVIDDVYLEVPSLDNLTVQEADIRRNANLQETGYAVRALEIGKQADRSAWYPRISAFGTLNYGRPGANFFADQWQFYYTGGIELSMSLWDGGTRSNALERDEARKRQLEARRQGLYRDLLTRGLQTRQSLLSLKEQYATAGELLSQKKRKYDLVQELWQAGQKSTLDVLTAEQELTEADVQARTLKIRLLSLYQEFLLLTNRPLWQQSTQQGAE